VLVGAQVLVPSVVPQDQLDQKILADFYEINKHNMKKNIIFLFVLGLALPLFGANSSPISCSDARLS